LSGSWRELHLDFEITTGTHFFEHVADAMGVRLVVRKDAVTRQLIPAENPRPFARTAPTTNQDVIMEVVGAGTPLGYTYPAKIIGSVFSLHFGNPLAENAIGS